MIKEIILYGLLLITVLLIFLFVMSLVIHLTGIDLPIRILFFGLFVCTVKYFFEKT